MSMIDTSESSGVDSIGAAPAQLAPAEAGAFVLGVVTLAAPALAFDVALLSSSSMVKYRLVGPLAFHIRHSELIRILAASSSVGATAFRFPFRSGTGGALTVWVICELDSLAVFMLKLFLVRTVVFTIVCVPGGRTEKWLVIVPFRLGLNISPSVSPPKSVHFRFDIALHQI
jgi:hypothetical protein